ncbi:type II toxin-antitoxin system RelE/ParE family toxin [Blautia schinkii]|nr:type II toxin-antitoxin system RelE/ParE family toxin [Blautia schinkii]
MKYKVMYTAGAKKDLRNIFRYISEELLAPENAAGQTERIMNAIRKLDSMPNRNRLYEEEPWHSKGLRFFPVDNYLIFYMTDFETETVYVVRIMYGGRDVRNQLSMTEDISKE